MKLSLEDLLLMPKGIAVDEVTYDIEVGNQGELEIWLSRNGAITHQIKLFTEWGKVRLSINDTNDGQPRRYIELINASKETNHV